jgi:hypothetical protein
MPRRKRVADAEDKCRRLDAAYARKYTYQKNAKQARIEKLQDEVKRLQDDKFYARAVATEKCDAYKKREHVSAAAAAGRSGGFKIPKYAEVAWFNYVQRIVDSGGDPGGENITRWNRMSKTERLSY